MSDLATPLEVAPRDHVVQFYEHDAALIGRVAPYLRQALESGFGAIAVATQAHERQLREHWRAEGFDLGSSDRFIALDAAKTLALILRDGWPQADLFDLHVGALIERLSARCGNVVAFGEMVALLFADGRRAEAVHLEGLWNALRRRVAFSLYCAYPMQDCTSAESIGAFRQVCCAHSEVIPAESYAPVDEADRVRAVAELQQKARALEHEIGIRRRVERLLADRERELSDFLENGPQPMHRAGPDGTILWANRAELALLGYEASEYVGHNIADFHVNKQSIARILERLADGESLRDHPAKLRAKNGEVRAVVISSNALRENGKLVSTRCVTRDVTDQSSAQETARERGAVMHLAMQGARMGYFVADLDTGRVRASQELAELLGMTFAFDWTLEAFLALLHPEDRDSFRSALTSAISGRGEFLVEYRVRRDLSDWRWFEARGEAVYDHEGRAVRFYGVCADVTNRKREEQMLAHLAAVVDNAEDAIISKNLDGIVLSWNRGAARIFGYEAGEMIGRPITTLIPPELMHEEAAILAKVRAGERLEHYMTTRVAKDGSRRLVSLAVSPVRDASGKIVGASKIAREIRRIEAVTTSIPLGPSGSASPIPGRSRA